MKCLLVILSFILIYSVLACQQNPYAENRTDQGMMDGGMMGPGMMGPGRQPESNQNVPRNVGEAVFYRNCNSCHPNGGNTVMPNRPIIGSQRLNSFRTFLAFIRNPLPPMPTFPSEVISESQARQLYQFIEANLNR